MSIINSITPLIPHRIRFYCEQLSRNVPGCLLANSLLTFAWCSAVSSWISIQLAAKKSGCSPDNRALPIGARSIGSLERLFELSVREVPIVNTRLALEVANPSAKVQEKPLKALLIRKRLLSKFGRLCGTSRWH